MRIFALYTFIFIAGLGVCSVGWPDPPQPPSLAPIVIGGDEPETRGTSSCERVFGSDALAVWITGTVHSLCKKGDANSLLAVFLISSPLGSQGTPDLATLDRAYAAGKSNPVVLWTVALSSKCHMPFQASECSRMMTAAKLLSRADPENAMAWLTLGFAADESLADPEEIGSALDHAIAAPRFHDYGFDLTKRAVAASGQVPVPADVLEQLTPEQFRLQFANPSVSQTSAVISWLNQGCNATNAAPPPASQQCTQAKELLRRGDSIATLSANQKLLAQMRADPAADHPGDQTAYARAVRALADSNSEQEYLGKLKEP